MLYYKYIIASFSLILWCTFHSLLISNSVTTLIERKIGIRFRFYRIVFNLFALVTFLLVLFYFKTLPAEMLFRWDGGFQFIQFSLMAVSFYLFIAGARRYDALRFLGLRQLKSAANHKMLNTSGKLEIKGLHKIIRHPWYAGSIVIIWTRNIDSGVLIQNIIMTAYLIIGSHLEERKLVKEFGKEYNDYRQRVSMLFPFIWIRMKIQKSKQV